MLEQTETHVGDVKCVCCKETIEGYVTGSYFPPGVKFDEDLGGLVCATCATNLVKANAWLRGTMAIKGCLKR